MIAPLHFILSLSIIFAVIIGIVRFKKIDPSYYPFIYAISLSFLVEVTNQFLMQKNAFHIMLTMMNVFAFLDFFLFTWLFYNWGLFGRGRTAFAVLIIIFFVIWAVSSVLGHPSARLNYYFLILYSFALIFFSVNTFNKAVVHERISIFMNAKFWICLGIIIFYSIFIVACAASLSVFEYNVSKAFREKLQEINVYANLLVNLLYAVAVLWIPRKKKFTTLF